MRRADRAILLRVYLPSTTIEAIQREADKLKISKSAWTGALIRRRLRDAPKLLPADAAALRGVYTELRRIRVCLRTLRDGELDADLQSSIEAARTEIALIQKRIRDALKGNFAYWNSTDD